MATASAAPGPTATPPPLVQVGKPTAAESQRILNQFRQSGWAGYIEFVLRAMPRRGEETVYQGRLWGGRNEQGSVTRIELSNGKNGLQRFLLQNGEKPGVWRFADGKVTQLDAGSLFAPLIPGVEITAFDLQMPYLYWPDMKVDSVARVRGRPAYVFVFNPPTTAKLPVAYVRTYFDTQYNAPVQTELGDAKRVLKTTSLVDLKKVGEQWIPKSFDVKNEVSRDKTRFEVTGAALNLQFAPAVFAPASLGEDLPGPAPDRIVRIDP